MGKKILKFWCYKNFLISNCRTLKGLSYFKKFISISRDDKTAPDGRIIKLAYN